MIISVSGLIGSGKDTIADYLVAEHNFRRESFAGALKDAVAAIFSWDRELLEGKTPEGRHWREKVDQWWSERLGIPDLTPRRVLQNWGTEVCRKGFHNDIWIASLENKLRKTTENIVISDARFPNELRMVHGLDGFTVKVERGANPEWYKDAMVVNSAGDMSGAPVHVRQAFIQLANCKIHASEYAWVGYPFDVTVNNNGTVDDLYREIDAKINPLL